MTRVWMACVQVNRSDKAYFLNQLAGFSTTRPRLISWGDVRPETERGDALVMNSPWERHWTFPGGYRLKTLLRRIWARIGQNPYGMSPDELNHLTRTSRSDPPDVIYAHTGFMGLRLLPLKQALGLPMAVHFHGMDITLSDRSYRRTLKRSLPHFDRIIVVGQWMVDRMIALGAAADCISVIPMGTPTGGAKPPSPQSKTGITFVSVGRMVALKGFDIVIEAFACVKGSHRLVLVGDGPERPGLEERAARLNVADRVVFTGSLPQRDALEQIRQADVFTLHALDEPGGPEAFGVVISEAMELGKPVIASRCGGLPDQVVDGQTGFLVEQKDIEGQAGAMQNLITQPQLRAEMGGAGQARVRAMFDTAHLAGKVETELRKLVADQNRSVLHHTPDQ